jgi:hypothetical protein
MTEVVLKDRVKETTTTTGTGTVTLAGAVAGFQTFAAIGDGNLTFYTITDNTDWEVGVGMYFSTGPLLERNAVLDSSNSGNRVDWSAGTREVFVTYPSSIADFLPIPDVFAYASAVAGTGAVGEATVTTL